jgi:hypothetical protein
MGTGSGALPIARDHEQVDRVAREALNGRGNHYVAGGEVAFIS